MIFILLAGTGGIIFWLLDKPDVDRYERTDLTVGVDVEVKNIGNYPAEDIPLRLALPLDDMNHQEVRSITMSQNPTRNSSDSWGNNFIHYQIEKIEPGESFNINIELEVELTSVDHTMVEVKGMGDIDDSLSKYLLDSSLIIVNHPSIIQLAREIANKSANLVDIAWNSYEWILDNIYYQQVPGELDSVTTLRNGEGGSAEFSNLYISLLRANGIPARRLSGWGNPFRVGETLQLSRFSHGWVEFHAGELGWVQVDPAWGVTSKFDSFASADNRHIAMTRGADVKFMLRGPFTEPFGDTNVDTDYTITVLDKNIINLSPKRDIIRYGILSLPGIFVIFIFVQIVKKRRVSD